MGTLTDAEKVDVRRHCGYPAYGAGAAGFQSWRFFEAYGLLEYRLNHLATAEETLLRSYLTQLNTLETDIYGVRANLDTAAAAIWTRNPVELDDRERLLRSFRMKLVNFLGLPPGPNMGGGNSVQLVV